jgi:hypothetical protein
MKTYTEEEVTNLLTTQRENCWVALHRLTNDKSMLDVVITAPEPGMWRVKKEYTAIFKSKDTDELISLKISKETRDFLVSNCNKEKESFGVDLYKLNNLTFKIEDF